MVNLLCQRSLLTVTLGPRIAFFHTTRPSWKESVGKIKITVDKSKPLTYDMAFKPRAIAYKKGWLSHNTAQLEDTFLKKEEIGQDLPHKTFLEDMFIRKFMHGTWPEAFVSELIIKRQHNLIRISGIIVTQHKPREVYFLIGYTEELLSAWLKCPVRLELQSTPNKTDVVYKYV